MRLARPCVTADGQKTPVMTVQACACSAGCKRCVSLLEGNEAHLPDVKVTGGHLAGHLEVALRRVVVPTLLIHSGQRLHPWERCASLPLPHTRLPPVRPCQGRRRI